MKTVAISLRKALMVMGACLLWVSIFSSCSKEKTDMSSLLATVPSSAGGVMGINLPSMLEKAGFKVENNQIIPGKDTSYDFSRLPSSQREMLELFFNGDSGVDPAGAIVFCDANRTYLTFGLNDTEQFKKLIQKRNNTNFSENSGVEICEDVAVRGAQAWVMLEGNSIDPNALIGYAQLSASQSFLQQPFGMKLAEMDHDLMGWGKLGLIARKFLNFQETTMLNLFSSTLFEDAEEIEMEADFDKGEFEAEIKVLDGKGKLAKYLLPNDKIDVSLLKTIGSQCDVLVAADINKKHFEKLQGVLGRGSFGNIYKNFLETIENIDGTVAVGFSNPDALSENLSGVVTTDGKPSMQLKTYLSILGPIRIEDKLIRFSKGTMNGELKVADCADMLKGATIGIVSDFPAYPVSELSSFPLLGSVMENDLNLYCLKLTPEGNSVELEIVVKSVNSNENILKTILKANGGK